MADDDDNTMCCVGCCCLGIIILMIIGMFGGGSSSSGSYSNTLDVRTDRSEERYTKEVNLNVTGKLEARGSTLVAVIDSENKRKRLTT